MSIQTFAMQTAHNEQNLETFMAQEQRKDTFTNQKFMVYLRTIFNNTTQDVLFLFYL